jgi:hypothetical protein
MDDIYGIRRKRLQELLDSPRLAKLNRELDRADALDVSPSMFSQLKSPTYKIGDPLARKIEEKLGLDYGWMDQSAGWTVPSQVGRIDADKLAESIAALRQVSEDLGWPYDPVTHPVETALAYEVRCSMPAAPVMADVIDFGQRVAEILRRRGANGGPGDGGQAGGADQKRNAKRTGAKA